MLFRALRRPVPLPGLAGPPRTLPKCSPGRPWNTFRSLPRVGPHAAPAFFPRLAGPALRTTFFSSVPRARFPPPPRTRGVRPASHCLRAGPHRVGNQPSQPLHGRRAAERRGPRHVRPLHGPFHALAAMRPRLKNQSTPRWCTDEPTRTVGPCRARPSRAPPRPFLPTLPGRAWHGMGPHPGPRIMTERASTVF